ncbi:MAG: STT3 domain-containing protein [Candidatus Woesearchaeota archaeon]
MDKDEDEEITIDFAKIKRIFSKKKPVQAKKEIAEAEAKIDEDIKEDQEDIKTLKHEKAKIEYVESKIEHQIEKKEEAVESLRQEKDHLQKAEDLEKDEEIAIDFSKLKRFFKSDSKKEPVKQETAKDDDEVSIDFTKIKGFFKRSKDNKPSEEEGLDWKKISGFFLRYQIIFLILIPILISVQLRHISLDLPVTDDWAKSSVENYFKSQISAQVDQQYPNLPDANKQQFVASEFQKFMQEQKAQVDLQVQETSKYFKQAMQDNDGHTYLPDIDTYYWLRHARNVVTHGYPGDKIVNGVQIDDHMIAPLGRPLPGDMFHAYALAYSYQFLHVFDSTFELDRVCFFMPILVSALCVIPAFFIGRRFGGNTAGFIAALVMALHPAFLVRSSGGVCDTDSYNVFFPLIITWLFIEAIEGRTWKHNVFLALGSGFLVGLYSFAWGGWWFIIDFILIAAALYIAYLTLIHLQALKKSLTSFFAVPVVRQAFVVTAVFFVSSLIAVSIFLTFSTFTSAVFAGAKSFSGIKDVGTVKVWPNVFTTVAEQNEINFSGIIDNMGGTFLFLVALLGIVVIGFAKDKGKRHNLFYVFLLSFWFIATIYASTKGVRWVLLLVPAFAIALAAASTFVYANFSRWAIKEFGVNKHLARTAILLLILFLVFIYPRNMVASAYSVAKQDIPLINRAWVDSLQKINQNSSQDAIVNSWWDYGHWFKYLADRAVTFDGTSQDYPMAYWIGKSLLTDNEDLAVGILRMLDCGSYKAFDELDKVIQKPYRSVEILNDILVQDKVQASKTLKQYGLTEAQVDVVLHYTHCDPPEDFFIASEDMVGKSGVWAHFGSWDFRKATIFNQVRLMDQAAAVSYLQSEFNYSAIDARNTYNKVKSLDPTTGSNDWIAPWPSYASNLAGCNVKGSVAQCDNGLEVDLNTYDAYLLTQAGKKHPQELVVPTLTGLLRKKFVNDTIPYSAVLMPKGAGYSSVIMQPELAASMFTRQFFMAGHSLTHFKPFSYERSPLGTEVYVYKIDWQGSSVNIMDDVKNQAKLHEERHARHILVNDSAEADKILAELKAGASFAALAKNYSTDTTAQNGGDIGWVKPGQTIGPFNQVLFNLTVGKYSGVVKTDYGYHIIQLLGVRNQTIAAS